MCVPSLFHNLHIAIHLSSHLKMSNDEDGPPYDTEYQSEDADIRIISSDDVEFKVHSYQLQAAR